MYTVVRNSFERQLANARGDGDATMDAPVTMRRCEKAS
jgi:hypothetical protein